MMNEIQPKIKFEILSNAPLTTKNDNTLKYII